MNEKVKLSSKNALDKGREKATSGDDNFELVHWFGWVRSPQGYDNLFSLFVVLYSVIIFLGLGEPAMGRLCSGTSSLLRGHNGAIHLATQQKIKREWI